MKIAWITTFYRTEELKDIKRLKKQIDELHLSQSQIFVVDNRKNNRGYAAGINKGLKKAFDRGYDLFIICNPDISFKKVTSKILLEGLNQFDIVGGTMKQDGKIYYGGEIDKWRMSGGLIDKKPSERFAARDFVSGAFMVIKRKVLESMGYFEEKYFIYYEEVDYCYSARKAGFRVGIDQNVEYDHMESSNQENPNKNFLLARNRLIFFMKYSSISQKLYELIRLPKTIVEEIPRIITYILSSSFLMNFFSLNVSSLIIKLTSFVNFLFLVKYLTAPEYGIYTLVWAQVSILSPLADFGTTSYGVVYLPTEKEAKYQSLYSFRIFVSFFIFIGTVVLSLFLFRGSTKMYAYILVTSTVIFTNMFSGSYFIYNALKNKLYRSSRNSIIFNILLVAAIILSLILFKRLLAVFITIFIFYNAYSIVNFFLLKKELPKFRFTFDFNGWKSIFGNLYIFVLISFFAGLYSRIDIFLLKIMKGDTEVGIYSAGSKFLEALLFMAASYNVTAAPILARLTKSSELLKNKIIKDFIFLFIIGFGTSFFLFFFSPYLLTTILKKNYLLSIPVLRIVIFTLPFILFNSIWLNVLYVLKKTYLAIFVFLSQTVINLGLNLIFIPRYSYIASSYITVFSEIMNCVVLIILVRYVWKKYYENIH